MDASHCTVSEPFVGVNHNICRKNEHQVLRYCKFLDDKCRWDAFFIQELAPPYATWCQRVVDIRGEAASKEEQDIVSVPNNAVDHSEREEKAIYEPIEQDCKAQPPRRGTEAPQTKTRRTTDGRHEWRPTKTGKEDAEADGSDGAGRKLRSKYGTVETRNTNDTCEHQCEGTLLPLAEEKDKGSHGIKHDTGKGHGKFRGPLETVDESTHWSTSECGIGDQHHRGGWYDMVEEPKQYIETEGSRSRTQNGKRETTYRVWSQGDAAIILGEDWMDSVEHSTVEKKHVVLTVRTGAEHAPRMLLCSAHLPVMGEPLEMLEDAIEKIETTLDNHIARTPRKPQIMLCMDANTRFFLDGFHKAGRNDRAIRRENMARACIFAKNFKKYGLKVARRCGGEESDRWTTWIEYEPGDREGIEREIDYIATNDPTNTKLPAWDTETMGIKSDHLPMLAHTEFLQKIKKPRILPTWKKPGRKSDGKPPRWFREETQKTLDGTKYRTLPQLQASFTVAAKLRQPAKMPPPTSYRKTLQRDKGYQEALRTLKEYKKNPEISDTRLQVQRAVARAIQKHVREKVDRYWSHKNLWQAKKSIGKVVAVTDHLVESKLEYYDRTEWGDILTRHAKKRWAPYEQAPIASSAWQTGHTQGKLTYEEVQPTSNRNYPRIHSNESKSRWRGEPEHFHMYWEEKENAKQAAVEWEERQRERQERIRARNGGKVELEINVVDLLLAQARLRGKARGHSDGITKEYIQCCNWPILGRVKGIFRRAVGTEQEPKDYEIPEEWYRMHPTAIGKKQTKMADPASWRYICAGPTIAKWFFSSILQAIRRQLGGFPLWMVGFTPGAQPQEITDYIRSLLHKSHEWEFPVCWSSIDIEKAFDSVQHSTIIKALADRGLGPCGCRAMAESLRTSIKLQIMGEEAEEVWLQRGVGQGRAEGPHLWNEAIYYTTKDLVQRWEERGSAPGLHLQMPNVTMLVWADNLYIFSRGVAEWIQQIQELQETLAAEGLAIKPDECFVQTNRWAREEWCSRKKQKEEARTASIGNFTSDESRPNLPEPTKQHGGIIPPERGEIQKYFDSAQMALPAMEGRGLTFSTVSNTSGWERCWERQLTNGVRFMRLLNTVSRKPEKTLAKNYVWYTNQKVDVMVRVEDFYAKCGNILLYGAGGWNLPQHLASSMDAWETRCVAAIWNIRVEENDPDENRHPGEVWKSTARSKRKEMELPSLLAKQLAARWRWMGHVARLQKEHPLLRLIETRTIHWWETVIQLRENTRGPNKHDERHPSIQSSRMPRFEQDIHDEVTGEGNHRNWMDMAKERSMWAGMEEDFVTKRGVETLGRQWIQQTCKAKKYKDLYIFKHIWSFGNHKPETWQWPRIQVVGDCEPAIERLRGLQDPKAGIDRMFLTLENFAMQIGALPFNGDYFRHVKRKDNSRADALANEAMDKGDRLEFMDKELQNASDSIRDEGIWLIKAMADGGKRKSTGVSGWGAHVQACYEDGSEETLAEMCRKLPCASNVDAELRSCETAFWLLSNVLSQIYIRVEGESSPKLRAIKQSPTRHGGPYTYPGLIMH